MSSPHSNSLASVNECIPPESFSLYYASVDDAVQLIKIAGYGAWLTKADITDAFKIMPIHSSDWPLFGVKWKSLLYFAVRLTFGCRRSPHIFNCLSKALCWILLNVCKLPFVLHLLDDFLIDFPSSQSSVLDTLKSLFSELGVPLSNEKTVGLSISLEFLSIVLDSVQMQAALPNDKLLRIRSFLESFLVDRTVSKQDMLSLLGHLNFTMRIIPQGRSFISRLLTLAHSVDSLIDLIRRVLIRPQVLVAPAQQLERHFFFLQQRFRIIRCTRVIYRCSPFHWFWFFFSRAVVRREMFGRVLFLVCKFFLNGSL